MDIVPIYKRVIGLDVRQAQITGCAIIALPDGSVTHERREFGGFKRDRKAMAKWARSIGPDVVVMESTGIYWKSPYAALEGVSIVPWVVNAHHVKAVPGRKIDVADAQWLASLARAGLLRASFIAKADLRGLRHIARQRQKLGGMLAAHKKQNTWTCFSGSRRHWGDHKAKCCGPSFEGRNASGKLLLFVALLPLIDEFFAPRQHKVHHACELVRHRRVGAGFVHAGAQAPVERTQGRVAA
jgi:hypothetical protein